MAVDFVVVMTVTVAVELVLGLVVVVISSVGGFLVSVSGIGSLVFVTVEVVARGSPVSLSVNGSLVIVPVVVGAAEVSSAVVVVIT